MPGRQIGWKRDIGPLFTELYAPEIDRARHKEPNSGTYEQQ